MRHLVRRTNPWVAALFATVTVAPTLAQAPSASPAWPQQAVADPATLGFTKAGLDALDAGRFTSVPRS